MALASRPPAPTSTPSSGSLNQRLAQLAVAVSRKADMTSVPVYQAIRLVAADGSTWQITVDPGGGLHTEAVTR